MRCERRREGEGAGGRVGVGVGDSSGAGAGCCGAGTLSRRSLLALLAGTHEGGRKLRRRRLRGSSGEGEPARPAVELTWPMVRGLRRWKTRLWGRRRGVPGVAVVTCSLTLTAVGDTV